MARVERFRVGLVRKVNVSNFQTEDIIAELTVRLQEGESFSTQVPVLYDKLVSAMDDIENQMIRRYRQRKKRIARRLKELKIDAR